MTTLAARVGAARQRGLRRLADQWVHLLQIGVGVLLAWFVAGSLLGHDLPFFAPVTAILCLGLTYGQRPRRIVEVTVGVAIGIAVGDVIVVVVGTGAWQMAVVVVAAMALALVISTGQLLVIQAGVQAVFIVALTPSQGAAVERWLDAVVGGLVALLIGALAPTAPVRRPRALAARTVRRVTEVLDAVVDALRSGDRPAAERALAEARSLEGQLGELRAAASEGAAAVRQSPLLRRYAPQAAAASDLVGPLDRCVRNLRVLARRADIARARGERVPGRYLALVDELAAAGRDLARVLDEHDTPAAGRRVLERVAGWSARVESGAPLSAEMIRGQVRSMVVDLLVVAGVDDDEAIQLVPESYLP
ncbi:MAG: FUSC family protein [Phycicoccus sp.]